MREFDGIGDQLKKSSEFALVDRRKNFKDSQLFGKEKKRKQY